MVADGEMSFTHARPDNFAEYTFGRAVDVVPVMPHSGKRMVLLVVQGSGHNNGGYSYSGLDSMEIEQVSLVLHISIPDALPSDEVNVISRITVLTFS